MNLTGALFVAGGRPLTETRFSAVDPSTGKTLQPEFSAAGAADVERACAAAEAAFPGFASAPADDRARLLERIAEAIMDAGDALLDRANAETGLPLPRLTGERARTVNQLRLFAEELREGSWMGLRADHALPDRAPLPRPDLRLRKIALGPIAVFGASNFPLAFSVAGGDTASALAAGCPVVVKGHPSHPGTSEIVAGAIAAAVAASRFEPGVFSMLSGPGHDLGIALVTDPRIKAVGFTGSRAGGLALVRAAAARPEPIPVYAEMSAANPVILLPSALAERAQALGAAYAASLTLGAGQFCTNPGLVFAIDHPALGRFTTAAKEAVTAAPAQVMLNPGIHDAYIEGVERLSAHPRVETLACGEAGDGPNRGRAALFAIDVEDFAGDEEISQEVFGASSVLIRCRNVEALQRALAGLEGQLTASVHFASEDESTVGRLIPLLERKAGRLIANGWPTGVEVSHAMVHGGPFPATSDGRSTSVGTLAIDRFLRPVCYQDFPDDLLPPPLRNDALAAVPRRIDGRTVAP